MRVFIAAFICVCFFSSCKKEFSEQFYPYENNLTNDTAWKNNINNNAPVLQITNDLSNGGIVYVDSFNASTGAPIAFSDSLKMIFPAHICTLNSGSTLTGYVKVELTQLRKKGDFIRYSKPTTSSDKLLQSGGSFNVRLSQNGSSVYLTSNGAYQLIFNHPTPTTEMKFFYEEKLIYNNESVATWVQTDSLNNLGGYVTLAQSISPQLTYNSGYNVVSKKINWINCDFFNDTTQPYTKANIALPPNFTNNNTQVFAVFKNKNIVAKFYANIAARLFYFSKIPVNSEVTFITISKLGSDYYLGTKSATIQNSNIISLNPELKSLSYINTYIENL
jgi:hypothetical protein